MDFQLRSYFHGINLTVASKMEILCLEPTPHAIGSCNSLAFLKQTHAVLLKSPNPNPNLLPKLIASYHRLGDPCSAVLALDRSPQQQDAFFFNSLIQCYIFNSQFRCTFELYIKMITRGIPPNQYTFPLLFRACSSSLVLDCGVQLHSHSIKCGFISNFFVAAAAMDMYMKNAEVERARKVFDGMPERDTVAWNVLVTGYSQNWMSKEALAAYNEMQSAGFDVGQSAVASILSACSQLQLLHQGKFIHAWVLKYGFDADTVTATALIEMYANCEDVKSANRVFDEMNAKDLVSWNCLIAGCARKGFIEGAIRLLVDMQKHGLKPNGSSLAGILPSIAQTGMLHMGKSCHGFTIRHHLAEDEFVRAALLDFYAKSGDLRIAQRIFDTMSSRSVVDWSAMIAGYGTHGNGTKALDLFDEMLASNARPNHVTFVGVLSACVHSGLIEKGKKYFQSMIQEHGITPLPQHFACMVDLLARAAHFNEAMELISSMPVEPAAGVWGALLSGCRVHGNIKLAKLAGKKLFELSPSEPGFYVLLSNTYAAAGMWEEVGEVRKRMREMGLRKEAGWSSIEIGREIHYFISGDTSHHDSCEIYQKVEEMVEESGRLGYKVQVQAVLHDVDQGMKGKMLKGHSEKLAMAYGLLKTAAGRPIRVVKNLRTCEDCHVFAKYVSMVTARQIILRDGVRFHHISGGDCTCGDYW
ncbi:Pentatricopeptide repeat-containing protein [Apostasia shenzhenica]|uniref:Pentatricopeptide repeat-containing protein n=1 Tax=Apostasia shenzhenica TaxID=1088818 RepID=A0A2I0ASH1_9ASPA|nr:Pentatricopeptide repeat-containing protein [Apostasia shenzhenica]